jgi:hypothetical protein
MATCKPVSTPLPVNLEVSLKDSPEVADPELQAEYRAFVSSLTYSRICINGHVSRLGYVLPASLYLHTSASLNTDPTNMTTTPKVKSSSSKGVVPYDLINIAPYDLIDIAQSQIAMHFELLSIRLPSHSVGNIQILVSADINYSYNLMFVYTLFVETEPGR